MAVNIDDTKLQNSDEEALDIVLLDEGETGKPDIGTKVENNIDKETQREQQANKTEGKQSKKDKAEEEIEFELNDSQEEVDNSKTSGKGDSDGVSWKEVIKYGIDKGIFTDTPADKLDELGDDIEAFSEVLQNELATGIDQAVNERFNSLNEVSQGLINHLINGGKVDDFVKSYTNDYTKVTDQSLASDKSLQEKVVRDYYKRTTNWSDEKINKFVIKHKDLDELGDEAKSALKGIQDIQKRERTELEVNTKKSKAQFEEQQRQRVNNIEKMINETKEFAGISVTPKLKNTIRENIMDDKTFAKINADLDKYRFHLAALDAMGLLDGNIDSIKNKLTDKATKDVKKTVESYDFSRGGKTKRPAKDDNKDAINSLIGHLDEQFSNFNM